MFSAGHSQTLSTQTLPEMLVLAPAPVLTAPGRSRPPARLGPLLGCCFSVSPRGSRPLLSGPGSDASSVKPSLIQSVLISPSLSFKMPQSFLCHGSFPSQYVLLLFFVYFTHVPPWDLAPLETFSRHQSTVMESTGLGFRQARFSSSSVTS